MATSVTPGFRARHQRGGPLSRTLRALLIAALIASGAAALPALAATSGSPAAAPLPPQGPPPPGANNWSCQPGAHPNPVVLVHGLGATMAENWAEISPLLARHGFCVFAL